MLSESELYLLRQCVAQLHSIIRHHEPHEASPLSRDGAQQREALMREREAREVEADPGEPEGRVL